jgi:hypothetical protein
MLPKPANLIRYRHLDRKKIGSAIQPGCSPLAQSRLSCDGTASDKKSLEFWGLERERPGGACALA